MKVIGGIVAVLVFVVLALGAPLIASVAGPAGGACGAVVVGAEVDDEQAGNAAVIVAVVRRLGLARRAAVIAVATARQESSLRNLPFGDAAGPDSRGLFQQRPQFYPDIDPLDPAQAAEAFLRRLVRVPGWETAPLPAAAQAVQRSAHPDLYADDEAPATMLIDRLWDTFEAGLCRRGGARIGSYALPLDASWFAAHPGWLAAPHHDYPAIDVPVPTGTPVFSVVAGTVVAAPAGGSCGEGVVIDGDDGHRYTYCHGVRPLVPAGARVAAGDPIMVSGNTGHSTGPHLHLQIHVGAGGPLVCPQPALAAWFSGRPVDIAALPDIGCVG